MHQSLDGYCATEDGKLDWIPYNEAFEKFAERLVKTVGSPMYGRVTYEMMQSYWPTLLHDESASLHDKEHAKWYDGVEKIVFSTTGIPAQPHTTVISDNIEAEVKKLKDGEGGDLVIFGSPTLARSLMDHGLIDEFQFTLVPVILGKGLTFMRSIKEQVNLELVSSELIDAGVLALHYKVLR